MTEERAEKLAVNLFDIEKLGPLLVGRVLGGKINKEVTIMDPNKEDEVAVELTCSLLTAALAIDVLRSENRKDGLPPVRAYIFREYWSKIPSTGVLTVEHRGVIVLNPVFFPKIVAMAEATPLETKPITFGD